MIEHLKHADIDYTWWDAQLDRCANANWYARSSVLDIAAPGWDALVQRSTGAIMPLTRRRKFGVNYLYQPFGLQQLGVFAPMLSPEVGLAFLNAIPAHFRYWDICLNTQMTAVTLSDASVTERTNYLLPLDRSSEALRGDYSENHRRNLRKAADAAPFFTDLVAPGEFVELFIRTTGERFGNATPRDMERMGELITALVGERACHITGVRKDHVLRAAVCWVVQKDRLVLFKSAVDDVGMGLKSMFHLVDRTIAAHSGTHTVLDFAGSNTPSVARFYSGFGAEPTVYLRLLRNDLPFPLKWFKK